MSLTIISIPPLLFVPSSLKTVSCPSYIFISPPFSIYVSILCIWLLGLYHLLFLLVSLPLIWLLLFYDKIIVEWFKSFSFSYLFLFSCFSFFTFALFCFDFLCSLLFVILRFVKVLISFRNYLPIVLCLWTFVLFFVAFCCTALFCVFQRHFWK